MCNRTRQGLLLFHGTFQGKYKVIFYLFLTKKQTNLNKASDFNYVAVFADAIFATISEEIKSLCCVEYVLTKI